jgi:CubicO group peptidase (beta-lactamase class C family)
LDYDARVARYWPAFGARGKERVTVRDALTHRAGVPQMPEGLEPADICDWEGITAKIADLPLLWEPGTQTGYHAYTYGWILGEVLRRIDGRPIADFVQREIAAPLGLQDLYFGIPDGAEGRVAPLISEAVTDNAAAPDPDALLLKAIPPRLAPSARVHNRPDVRRASIPAGGGIMSARGIARHYAALIGEVDGVRLLPPERVGTATELQTNDVDLALGLPVRKALGYWLGGRLSPMSERSTAFGHPGAGGSIGFADPEYRLAVGFTKNRLVTALDPTQSAAYRVSERIREVLSVPSA